MFKYKLLFILCLFSSLVARDIPSDNKIQGRLNIINGASAECVMHQFYTNSGWTQIKGGIGRGGIDGLYYKKKNNTIREVLVSESKWNKSSLGRSGKNKTVKQMSQEWVLRTINKLIKKNPQDSYQTLKKFILNNQYRARLFKVKPLSNNRIQISIYKIKNKGLKTFSTIVERQLSPIDIKNPKNGFEKGLLNAYNSCRKQYLNKYLNILSHNQIDLLMKDNYIQKADVKHILR